MGTRKKPKKRKSDKYTTIERIEKRLKKAIRLGKSENYIKDLETHLEKKK